MYQKAILHHLLFIHWGLESTWVSSMHVEKIQPSPKKFISEDICYN